IMVVPFISSVMREVFLTVPTRLKESAYALGSTKWEVSWDIVLPYTRSAVIGGIFLGLGRALGETMAVAFVIGNSTRFTASLLEPCTTIAELIANDFDEATETYRSELLLLGFVLFIFTFFVLAIARLMLRQLSRREGRCWTCTSAAAWSMPSRWPPPAPLRCSACCSWAGSCGPWWPRAWPASTRRCSRRTPRRRWRRAASGTRSTAAR